MQIQPFTPLSITYSIYHMVENWSSGGFKHNSWDNNLGMPSLTGFTKAVWSHFLALKESNILSFKQILL